MNDKDLFLKSFEEKLRTRLDKKALDGLSNSLNFDEDISSVEYEQFRRDTMPKFMGFYEKACNFAEKILPIQPDPKSKEKFQNEIYKGHLGCTPTGIMSLAAFVAICVMILGGFIFAIISQLIGGGFIMIGLFSYMILQSIPAMLAKKLKSKANDEVIIAIFYIVAFMRFNSNFELAVNFAANYLNAPLSLDFKRLLWQLQNGEFPNIKRAFDVYLEDWRDENLEFLESIYLIESSLYESDAGRRISLLDKSLDIILQGNYEKMMHYAQLLRSKVTTFNMMGVVLPLLGLIILPLAASFGDPKNVWQIVFLLYNIVIPAGVGYFGFTLTFNRPSSVNSIKTPKNIKNLKQLQKYPLKLSKDKTIFINAKIPALFYLALFLFLGLAPVIFHATGVDLILNERLSNNVGDYSEQNTAAPFSYFQIYKDIENADTGEIYPYGPYGVYPGVLSLFIPLGIAFSIGTYLKTKYKNLISLRDNTKKLELQFPSAMFQLGNRINEGMAAELAFGAVSDTMKGTEAGMFFSKIDALIKFDGMSVESAIFDSRKGAINIYPSDLIMSSMKILVHAIEKGPEITAKTLVDLSRYLNEIHLAGERMKDLLAESIGSMKSQASFLGPVISAVVISIVSLVTMIMGHLANQTKEMMADQAVSGAGMGSMMGDSIPTYLFQGVVGVYMCLLIILLVYVVVNLESGEDPILTKYEIGEKLIGGITKYGMICGIGIIAFAYLGASFLP